MHPTTFHLNERVLSPPRGQHETIAGLRVVDVTYGDGQAGIISCWQLTPAELAQIQQTGKVYLAVLGGVHPPVLLTTDPDEIGLGDG